MNETEFQALFDSYQQALRMSAENPVPPKLHLMIYNYARLRHQQTSDVSADFYLFICGKLQGILDRYDHRRLPFYQYLAAALNFEFSHFLRRRKLPRSHSELLSVEELAGRRVELHQSEAPADDGVGHLFRSMQPLQRIYAKLALAYPLSFADLKLLVSQKRTKDPAERWGALRAYRTFLRFAESKRQKFLAERERLLKVIMRIDNEDARGNKAEPARILKRRASAQKKFFSMDTRIPIRIVAEVTGDSIATVQRQLKSAVLALKTAYFRWEKQNLVKRERKN
jgi:hypothetical protein